MWKPRNSKRLGAKVCKFAKSQLRQDHFVLQSESKSWGLSEAASKWRCVSCVGQILSLKKAISNHFKELDTEDQISRSLKTALGCLSMLKV